MTGPTPNITLPPVKKAPKCSSWTTNSGSISPGTDRTIQISGHMLRQSVMGSDLSYEDMMDDPNLRSKYDAVVTGSEMLNEADCWVVEMHANAPDVAYQMRKVWVDKTRYLPHERGAVRKERNAAQND
jgi:hypothetical protein